MRFIFICERRGRVGANGEWRMAERMIPLLYTARRNSKARAGSTKTVVVVRGKTTRGEIIFHSRHAGIPFSKRLFHARSLFVLFEARKRRKLLAQRLERSSASPAVSKYSSGRGGASLESLSRCCDSASLQRDAPRENTYANAARLPFSWRVQNLNSRCVGLSRSEINSSDTFKLGSLGRVDPLNRR